MNDLDPDDLIDLIEVASLEKVNQPFESRLELIGTSDLEEVSLGRLIWRIKFKKQVRTIRKNPGGSKVETGDLPRTEFARIIKLLKRFYHGYDFTRIDQIIKSWRLDEDSRLSN